MMLVFVQCIRWKYPVVEGNIKKCASLSNLPRRLSV